MAIRKKDINIESMERIITQRAIVCIIFKELKANKLVTDYLLLGDTEDDFSGKLSQMNLNLLYS